MAGDSDTSLNCQTIEEYQSDPRIACRYGEKCYQKNPIHINKYKHPPKTNTGRNKLTTKRGTKRKKAGGTGGPTPKDKGCNGSDDGHISDSSSASGSPKRKALDPKLSADDNENRDEEEKEASASPDMRAESPALSSKDLAAAFDSEVEMPPSPTDVRQDIKQKFMFEMPDDFYSFWDLCKSLNPSKPSLAFKDIGLKLVGPYDVLSGYLKLDGSKRKQSLCLLHWRYYYDPPEFQTVLKGDDSKQFHVGYFRDEPKSMPAFLASNSAAKNGVFTQVAENIFGAVNAILNDVKKSANPFIQSKVPKLQKALQEYARERDISLETKTEAMKQRNRKTVSKTFNGLGLLVPVEKRTEVGYRELIETDANLKRILNRIVKSERQADKDKALDQLQQVITAANIANDECDFGTSVELGLDLLAFGGSELEQSAVQLLSTGYSLLGRKEFSKIAQVHLKHRRMGPNLDILSS